jgi:hypothetical protein
MSGFCVDEEGQYVSVEDAAAEKQRIAAPRAAKTWRRGGPYNSVDDVFRVANLDPAQQAGEFFVFVAPDSAGNNHIWGGFFF